LFTFFTFTLYLLHTDVSYKLMEITVLSSYRRGT